jgi:hypothetical protein
MMKNRFNLLSEREFITCRNEIINEVLRSKKDGNIIGIISSILGTGMYLTAVDDFIIDGDSAIVILKQFDMSGYMFPTTRIPLSSIKAVCPFTSKYENPFLPKTDLGLKDMLA